MSDKGNSPARSGSRSFRHKRQSRKNVNGARRGLLRTSPRHAGVSYIVALIRGSVVVGHFAGRDAEAEAVLRRGEWAGGVGVVGAGGIVGFVEIEDHLTVLRRVGVEEAGGGVGFFAAG